MTLRAAAQPFTDVEAVRDAECACIAIDDPEDDVLEELIDVASDVLCIVSGGRVFGRATKVVLPCADQGCYVACGCGCGLDGIPLDVEDPVVAGVYINDEVVPSTEYRLHRDGSPIPKLVRISTNGTPPQPWPRYQSLWRNGQGDNTFRFTLTWGTHVNHVISQAAVELVCYLAADPKARRLAALPKGATTYSAGGTTVSTTAFTRLRDQSVERVKAGIVGPDTAAFMEIYAPFGIAGIGAWSPELTEGWTLHTLEAAS